MDRELKKRKKRFWVFCLTMVLMMYHVLPVAVAAEPKAWDADNEEDFKHETRGTIVAPGDSIKFWVDEDTVNPYIEYRDIDIDSDGNPDEITGEGINFDTIKAEMNEDNIYSHIVKAYMGTGIEEGLFKGWDVVVYRSSGQPKPVSYIWLCAAAYVKSNIKYEFKVDNVENTNPSTYLEEKEDIPLADAKKEGYEFKGWYKDAAYDESTKVTSISIKERGDVTLYGRFDSSISYNLNGGTSTGNNPTSYIIGTGVDSFADAEKTGYNFEGWYETVSGQEVKVESIPKERSGNVTLNAKFTIIDFDITYEVDGGTNAESNPETYTIETGVAGFADASKEGYKFEGWYSDATFAESTKVTSIPKGETGEVTLYAKFSPGPASYSIIYNLDGGTNAESNPTSYTEGTGVAGFADASKEGYQFEGWYSAASFTTKVTSISTTQTGAVTLYAKFSPVSNNPASYAITYNLDGGTNAKSNPTSYTEGTGVAGFADASKEGYQFEGWYSDASFTTKVTSISATQTGAVTLYAKFSPVSNSPASYGITYNLDGGTNAESNPTSYTEGTGVAGFADASKEGYQFEGWYSDATFTAKVTSISATQTGAVTLYAKFSPVSNSPASYGITYNLDGGTNAGGNPTSYTEGTGVTGFADASKEGYTFEGWYSDATFITKVTSISTEQTGDVTLYAKFVKIPDEPEEPEKPVRVKDEVPKTGDNMTGMLCFALLVLSGVGVVFMGRKQKANEDNTL